MTRRAALSAILAAFVLCGAGLDSTRLTGEQLRRIHTVAILSALGRSFAFERVPDTAFEWLGPPESSFLEISDWQLDAQIERATEAALAQRFVVKPVAYEPAIFSSWSVALLRRAAFDLNDDPAIDAYVLILRDWRADTIGDSVHEIGGLGLYRRDGMPAPPALFASYRVVVVDALDGRVLASRAGLTRDGRLPFAHCAFWPENQNALTPSQRDVLRRGEDRMIAATLPRTLAALGLTARSAIPW